MKQVPSIIDGKPVDLSGRVRKPGFASMDKERLKEVASQGGNASKGPRPLKETYQEPLRPDWHTYAKQINDALIAKRAVRL